MRGWVKVAATGRLLKVCEPLDICQIVWNQQAASRVWQIYERQVIVLERFIRCRIP